MCAARYGALPPDRVNVRIGYRHRDFDTRSGTLDMAIPKLRSGSYFPDWLLERRRWAEAAPSIPARILPLIGPTSICARRDHVITSPPSTAGSGGSGRRTGGAAASPVSR